MTCASLNRAQIIQKQTWRRAGGSGGDAMTALRHELEGVIGAYLRDECGLADVRAWLLDHVQAVLDTSDPELAALDGELWRLISEYDRRDRDEESIRAALFARLSATS